MLWLELTKNALHGGVGWNFGQCLWSPQAKKRGQKWPFWSALLQVRKGDSVAHLKYDKRVWNFVGTSVAASDGFTTSERPPEPDESGFAKLFNRVDLENYQGFPIPIPLKTVFREKDSLLRDYFSKNKNQPKSQRKHIFFAIQAGRLQCLNGAYLSETDDALAAILFGADYSGRPDDKRISVIDVKTGEALRILKTRVGQKEFSSEVRKNYSHTCCFPDCPVTDDKFLIGAHIARWTDVTELRGSRSNGLCLCLMHDKAFEAGLFTLGDDLRVYVAKTAVKRSSWAAAHLVPFEGKPIKTGLEFPSKEALCQHRRRHNFEV